MDMDDFVLIDKLCLHYKIEFSFLDALENIGLIEIDVVDNNRCIHYERVSDLEKMIRLHQELNVNIEGIDVVFNFIEKEINLKKEISSLRNRLSLYEDVM